jgi:hypothetical protein
MGSFTINFSDVQSFDALPAGVYTVALIDLEENVGGASGFPYFKATLEVLDGEFANRRLWTNLSLSPKAAWKLQEALIAFGESPDDLTAEFDFDPEKYLGVEFDVSVSQSSYEGRVTNVVDNFLPSGAQPPQAAQSAAKSGARRPAGRKPAIR